MTYLAVFDYSTSDVHIFYISEELDVTEEYLENLGFKISQIAWMVGKNITIIHHSELLK